MQIGQDLNNSGMKSTEICFLSKQPHIWQKCQDNTNAYLPSVLGLNQHQP